MCNVCCQEFSGWCKAFTRTERLLTILEVILLVVFIGFLTFFILHFIVCTEQKPTYKYEVAGSVIQESEDVLSTTPRQTLGPDVQCTWKPSQKTKATTHYYEYDKTLIPTTTLETPVQPMENVDFDSGIAIKDKYFMEGVEESDGEEPEEGFDKFVIALVKIKPLHDITFGCILTIVSEYWTLTAASCIEAIEEVESLDAFVMLARHGAAHGVAEVRLQPRFAAERRHDLAALRSAHALPPAPRPRLPALLDYLLLTVGERLTILGYGRFRTVEPSGWGVGVRAVRVYSLAGSACGAAGGAVGAVGDEAALRHLAGGAVGDEAALRHLAGGAVGAGGTCGARAVCAGPLYARGAPCNYCAGTPLLRGATLLGLMADSAQCGVACEPAHYVNLATHRAWIDALIHADDDYPL